MIDIEDVGIPCTCPSCMYTFAFLRETNGTLRLFAGLQIFYSIDAPCPACGRKLTYARPTKTYQQLLERYQKRQGIEN